MADDPLRMFEMELRDDEPEVRIAAMKKLRTLALALGADRTVRNLIPLLHGHVEDDDEVLLAMAEQLGEFVDVVGGGDNAVCMVDLLAALAVVEETVVRDKAVESLCTAVRSLSAGTVMATVTPAIERLAKGDWFTSRVSACGLFATTYERLGAGHEDSKTLLRALYKTLCEDDTPMVRRAASKHIGNLAQALEKPFVVSDLIPLFNALSGDDQDSVRLLAIENCVKFAKVLSPEENRVHIMPLAKMCAEDKSWRVRNNVAKEFYELSAAVGPESTLAVLLACYIRLLQDPEAEVRASAAKNVDGYCGLIGPSRFITEVVPCLRDLANDVAQSVRVCLAESLVNAISKLTKEDAIKHILPLILQFLKADEAPEVRLKVLQALGNVAATVGVDVLRASILPALELLSHDSQWRVREKVVEQMPLLAQTLGRAIFEERLLELYLESYRDQVHMVRMASVRCLGPLAEQLGADWCRGRLTPQLRAMFDPAASYLQRMTVLYATKFLAQHAETASLTVELLPIVFQSTTDRVPNVRFVSARVLSDVAAVVDARVVVSEIKPRLESLARDSDKDVQFYAHEALAHLRV